MAKVILEALGQPRGQFLNEDLWASQLQQMSRRNRELNELRDEAG